MKFYVRTTGERDLSGYSKIEYTALYDYEHKPVDSYIKQLKQISDDDAVFMEDDIVLCDDFENIINEIIAQAPDTVINFFFQPLMYYPTTMVKGIMYIYNQCVYYPKGVAKQIAEEMERVRAAGGIWRQYDEMQGQAMANLGIDFLAFRPFIVQHVGRKSLLGNDWINAAATPYFLDDLIKNNIDYSDPEQALNFGYDILEASGIVLARPYIHPKDEKKIEIPYIETSICNTCNLNCKGCLHMAPLYDEPEFKQLDVFEKELIELSNKFNIREFVIMGGEPLLHPQIMDIIRLSRKYLTYANIKVATNGILLDSIMKDHSDEIKCLGCSFRLSNYTNVDYVECKTDSIPLVNEDKTEFFNLSLDVNGNCDANEQYAYCRSRLRCLYLKNGKLYHCGSIANIDRFKEYFKLNSEMKSNGIDIFTNTADDIVKFLNAPNEMCKYCNAKKQFDNKFKWELSKKDISEWTIKS